MKNLIRILMVGGAMVAAGFIVGCNEAKMATSPASGGKMKDGDGKMMDGKMKDGDGKMMGGEGKMKEGEGKMMGGEEKMKDMKGKDGK